jgi:hypothetical protein
MEAPARKRFNTYFKYIRGYLFYYKIFFESSEVSPEVSGSTGTQRVGTVISLLVGRHGDVGRAHTLAAERAGGAAPALAPALSSRRRPLQFISFSDFYFYSDLARR